MRDDIFEEGSRSEVLRFGVDAFRSKKRMVEKGDD